MLTIGSMAFGTAASSAVIFHRDLYGLPFGCHAGGGSIQFQRSTVFIGSVYPDLAQYVVQTFQQRS